MVEEGELKGESKFEEAKPEGDFITKEETMFKVDEKGIAIPEKYPVCIYDRTIEVELINEGLLLLATIRKQEAINKTIQEEIVKFEQKRNELEKKIEVEADEKVKKQLKIELATSKNSHDRESVETRINYHVIEDTLKENREVISGLKAEKEKQMVKKFVKLVPCNTTESIFSFEKGQTIDGKPTTDWVADLISKKVVEPAYSLNEAKFIKPDFKIALKEAIMEASNYKVKNYRDIMMMEKMSRDRPLTLKKKITTEENTKEKELES